MLAYHYSTALDLAGAAGEADKAAELEAPARRFLTLAANALWASTPPRRSPTWNERWR